MEKALSREERELALQENSERELVARTEASFTQKERVAPESLSSSERELARRRE